MYDCWFLVVLYCDIDCLVEVVVEFGECDLCEFYVVDVCELCEFYL